MLKMDLDNEGRLHIELEPQLRLKIASEFSKVRTKQMEPMFEWFDDPEVPNSEKEPYMEVLTSTMEEMNFLCQLLEKCGFSDQEIKELSNIPF